MKRRTPAHAIVLFDGECHVCSRAVQFIIPRDPRGFFRFAALQSPAGRRLLAQCHLSETSGDTMFLIRDDRWFAKSTAALQIARQLTGLWPALSIFLAVPRPLRDRLYDWFASRRYKWFGKRDQCMMPTDEIKSRFL